MRFIFPAVLLMTSVVATESIQEHNPHPYKGTHFEDVIKHYSSKINNESDAYKLIELISTGKGEVGKYSFNGVGPIGTYEEHKLAFELLEQIGNKYGSNFYIPYGPNYAFVRTALNYGALNKWFEENKVLIQKRNEENKKLKNGFKKLEEVFNKNINKRDAFNAINGFETEEYKKAKEDWEKAITIRPNGCLADYHLAKNILDRNILTPEDIRQGWSNAITIRQGGWLADEYLAKNILDKNILTPEDIRQGWSNAITIRQGGWLADEYLAKNILDRNILTLEDIRQGWSNAITIKPNGWLADYRLAKNILDRNILTLEDIRQGWSNATIISNGLLSCYELAKAILDLGIIDADSIREKFKEIKESNSYIDHDFIKSLLKSKTGESFNFSNDEIIEYYRLQNQNGRSNIPHIIAAAEDIMRNQRQFLRRHINNINNLNVGNNWGANETIMNAVNAIDEIKIFYSGEKYKDNVNKIIYDELRKFSSPVKSLKDLIAEFGCDDFLKKLNDFDAKLKGIKQKEYSVDNRIEILREIDALKNDLDKAIRDYAKQNIEKIKKYKELYGKFNKDEKIENKSEEAINKLISNEFYKIFYTDYFEKIIKGILIETQLKRSEKILPMIVDIVENTDAVRVTTDKEGEEKEILLKNDFENFFNGMVDSAIANNDEKKQTIGDTCQFDRFVQSALKTYVPFIELFNLGADVALNPDEFNVWKKMQGMCKDFEKIINNQYTFEKIAADSGFNQLTVTHNKTLLKELTERYISFVKSNATNEILEKLKIQNGADDKFFESIEKEMNILTYAMSETKEIDDSIDAVLGKVETYVPSKLENLVTNDAKKLYIREFIKGIFSVFSVNYENLSYEKSMNAKIDEMFKKMGLSEPEFEGRMDNGKLIENMYNQMDRKDKSLDEIVNEIYEMFGGEGSPVTKEEIEKIVQSIKTKEGKA